MTSSIETSESEALPWAPRGAAATAPAQPALETDAAPVVDKFKGDNAHLVQCIHALLNLDARGALVPHGIGGHARDLLGAAACRLQLVTAPSASDTLQDLHNELYRAQTTHSIEVQTQAIGKARILLARYRDSLCAAAAELPGRSLLRKIGEPLVCYCPPGVCQAPKGFKGPCNRAVAAQPAPVQPCKLCDGTRVVDDGEITHHECGIPYENGPVKCVKDCPACGGDSRAATAQARPQLTGGRMLVPVEPTPAMLYALWQHRDAMRGTSENKIARESYRAMLAAAPGQQDAHQAATDEAILALNAGERFFSESPSKYPEAGFGTQYHAGKPGVLEFARAVLALAAPVDTSSSSNAATEAL